MKSISLQVLKLTMNTKKSNDKFQNLNYQFGLSAWKRNTWSKCKMFLQYQYQLKKTLYTEESAQWQ